MRIQEGFEKKTVNDIPCIIASETNRVVIELNEISAFVWDCLAEGKTTPKTAHAVAEKFHLSMVKALYDVSQVIGKMKEAGLLE